MEFGRTTREVFDDWARDYHADGMEEHHWPRVRQAFERIAPHEAGRYLEIGVGNGYGLRQMATRQFADGRCWGLDLSPHMVDRALRKTVDLDNVEVVAADFLSWDPGPDLRFDLIFSMEVFYYFRDVQAGIDRAAALLAPGGTLMVLVNHYAEHEASHAWPAQLDTPMTLWSAAQYRAAFERAGLAGVEQRFYREDPAGAPPSDDPGTLATSGRVPQSRV